MATTPRRCRRRSRAAHERRRGVAPYLYLVPAFLVMAIITFYPLVFQVWMSFTDFGPDQLPRPQPGPGRTSSASTTTSGSRQSKLQIPNFEFVRLVLFNLWWAFSNVVVHVIIGVLVAVLLNTKGLMFRGFYRALFILPVVIPPIIVATVWRNMFDPTPGAVN